MAYGIFYKAVRKDIGQTAVRHIPSTRVDRKDVKQRFVRKVLSSIFSRYVNKAKAVSLDNLS